MDTQTYEYGQIFDVNENIVAFYLPNGQKDVRDKMPQMRIPKGEQIRVVRPKEMLCVVVETVSGNYWHADTNKFYIPLHEFSNYEQLEVLTPSGAAAIAS